MNHIEVAEALASFQILVDRREQATPKAIERYKSFGVPYERATLNYGDYCGTIAIDGAPLYDVSSAVKARCVIECHLMSWQCALQEGATASGEKWSGHPLIIP